MIVTVEIFLVFRQKGSLYFLLNHQLFVNVFSRQILTVYSVKTEWKSDANNSGLSPV